MDHTLKIEGFGVRLRPVKTEDAAFIVWLRNLEHAKGRVGDSATSVKAQEAWFENYFQRDGDYYFVIETAGGIAVGAYGIYGVTGSSAESGRWIIRPDVPAAIPSAILAFDLAFGKLGLTEVRVRTVSSNQGVLSLNRKFGFREVGVDSDTQINGIPVNQIKFLLDAAEWSRRKPKLLPLAKFAENQVLDWERSQ